MYITVNFYELPDTVDGLQFQFDLASIPGVLPSVVRNCANDIFKIRTDHALSLDALVSGHTIVETPDGGIASVVSHQLPVIVSVEAEPIGIFVGGLLVALSRDLSDEKRRWHYWKFDSRQLFEQALAVL